MRLIFPVKMYICPSHLFLTQKNSDKKRQRASKIRERQSGGNTGREGGTPWQSVNEIKADRQKVRQKNSRSNTRARLECLYIGQTVVRDIHPSRLYEKCKSCSFSD